MNAESKERSAKLSEQDSETAKRLYTEANKALEELAQIVARTLGVTLSKDNEVMLIPESHRSRGAEPMAKPIIFRGTEISCDHGICYCFDYDTLKGGLC
ncbi:hypothetical protein R20943_02250 [Paraburkholderia aspalathi]|nr:hypothetical protein R20943_02250 [Paraburkholderia aspalathi]